MTDDLKARLLKARLTEGTVEIDGIGTVRVRALSRQEVFEVQREPNVAAGERKMLALAMVDPSMTEADVTAWQAAAPAGELEPVTLKIQELSGIDSGAAKEAMQTFRDRPGD